MLLESVNVSLLLAIKALLFHHKKKSVLLVRQYLSREQQGWDRRARFRGIVVAGGHCLRGN